MLRSEHRLGCVALIPTEPNEVQKRLADNPTKLAILNRMEETGGEPAIVGIDPQTGEFLIFDCSPESPKGRRSLCFDQKARVERKDAPPVSSAEEMAAEIGIELLSEEQYAYLQTLGDFDLKTSSWILTPADVREKGGALFGDKRYGRVFTYHNGAQSYYAARGFRGCLRL